MANLPHFLQNVADFVTHLENQYGDLGANERGDNFAEVAQKIVPLTRVGQKYPSVSLMEKKSHDGGVDLFSAQDADGYQLFAQSKYKIRSQDDVDIILSKFRNFEITSRNGKLQSDLFSSSPGSPLPEFMVVTSSRIRRILDEFRKSERASKEYLSTLEDAGRVSFIDGDDLYHIIKDNYQKTNSVPASFVVKAIQGWLSYGNVLVGVMRGVDLKRLYGDFGDGLFFENIREFFASSEINDEIKKSISTPSLFLEKNNGITIRAEKVTIRDNGDVELTNAAIVNGCQTTMCIATSECVSGDLLVLVKVVETDKGWEIAKTANRQNPVTKIELELAQYIRPQWVRAIANELGYGVVDERYASANANSILTTIHQTRVVYDELRSLFIGIFSTRPANISELIYTDIRFDVLGRMLQNEDDGFNYAFETLVKIVCFTNEAASECKRKLSGTPLEGLFNRFFGGRPVYRMYVSILALCGGLGVNISSRSSDTAEETKRMLEFFRSIRSLLDNDKSKFIVFYIKAFEVIALAALQHNSPEEVQRNMHLVLKSGFNQAFNQLRLVLQLEV